MSPWIYLLISGLFEMGRPLGFKLAAQCERRRMLFVVLTFSSMMVSGYFLYLAQRSIHIGTAYVVWTSIGAVGTFVTGCVFFHEKAGWMRFAGIALIILGVGILKKCGLSLTVALDHSLQ